MVASCCLPLRCSFKNSLSKSRSLLHNARFFVPFQLAHDEIAGDDGDKVAPEDARLVGLAGSPIVSEVQRDPDPNLLWKDRMNNDPKNVRGVAVEDNLCHIDEPGVGRPARPPRSSAADLDHRAVGDAVRVQPGVNADLGV